MSYLEVIFRLEEGIDLFSIGLENKVGTRDEFYGGGGELVC